MVPAPTERTAEEPADEGGEGRDEVRVERAR